MFDKDLNVVDILQIGVIGLGFLLAVLAYHLLTKEQKQDAPRSDILKSIYVFMSFSVVLCVIGIVSQSIEKTWESNASEKETIISVTNDGKLLSGQIGRDSSGKEESAPETKYLYSHFVTMLGENDIQLRSNGEFKYIEEKIDNDKFGNTRIMGESTATVKWRGKLEGIDRNLLGYKSENFLKICDERGVYFLVRDQDSYTGFWFGESGNLEEPFIISPIVFTRNNDNLDEEDTKIRWPILAKSSQVFSSHKDMLNEN